MITSIIGLVIGALILSAGVYYLKKEKDDRESRRIYSIVSAVGGAITAICAAVLLMDIL